MFNYRTFTFYGSVFQHFRLYLPHVTSAAADRLRVELRLRAAVFVAASCAVTAAEGTPRNDEQLEDVLLIDLEAGTLGPPLQRLNDGFHSKLL
jgi:hypothetical protein